MKDKITQLKDLITEMRYYGTAQGSLMWDLWTQMPSAGAAYRHNAIGFISGKSTELIQSDRTKELADYFMENDWRGHEDVIERGMIRNFLFTYDQTTKVPAELQVELTVLQAKAQNIWKEALQASDYEMFKPTLTEMFELQKKVADAIDPHEHPLQVLSATMEEGIDIHQIERLFAEMKTPIVNLLKRIQNSDKQITDELLNGEYAKEDLIDFVAYLSEAIGLSKENSAFGEVQHPFCSCMGPRDARIGMNYDNYKMAVWAGIHESGHALYSIHCNDQVADYGLWGGIGGSVHESQARFYENIIGRSRAFWQHFYPEVQKRFPKFQNVSLDEYYKAVNAVSPSLIRVSADELTYSLHPIIRFEVEKAMFDGKVTLDELPDLWNAKYQEYLGLTPPNAQKGVLQDVHWSMGLFGYFHSYTLGNLYDGQFHHALLKDVPDVYEHIEQGNFSSLNNWLTKNIHQYSAAYSPDELIQKVTGEELQVKYYIDYLEKKYQSLYQL